MRFHTVYRVAIAAMLTLGAALAHAADAKDSLSMDDAFSAAKSRVKASATKVNSTEGGAAAVAVGGALAAPVSAAAVDKTTAVKAKAKATTVKAKAKVSTVQTKTKAKVQNVAAKTETGRTVARTAAQLLNINTAPLDKLEALPGVGDKYAQAIVDGRPYQSTSDLTKKKVIPASVYSKISKVIGVK